MASLAQRLEQLGSKLIIRRSRDSAQALKEVILETGAQAVFFNHLYDSISMVRDQQVKDDLRSNGILVQSFNADLLYEPWEVLDDQQQVRSSGRCSIPSFERFTPAHCCQDTRPQTQGAVST